MNRSGLTTVEAQREAANGRVEQHIHEAGDDHRDHGHQHTLQGVELARIGLVAIASLASWFGLWQYFTSFDVIALVAALAGGFPIYKEAFSNLLARRMTMELSMTIA